MKDLTKIGIKELERLVEIERNKVNNLFKSAKKSLGPLSPFSETIIDFEMIPSLIRVIGILFDFDVNS